ncbi:hypothetical protein PSH03_001351 [Micromonospora sp. PSH03]|uniref:hypothetical protein n=1 Tax=Micromonospora TaxID=1873 RepID=UPI001B368B61|nr:MULTISPECIES: hypothetical protein [Micromonospora]MBQ0992159.1 hypothetical protein [Micromonospora sp. H61]MCG5456451.1 hypothetical protein [Micromonospora salmantinae]
MPDIEVLTEALRDEGVRWRRLSDRMADVRQAASQLELAPTAFFIGDANMAIHSTSYDSFHSFMLDVISGAVVEFEQIAGALDRVANAYDRADAVVDLDLNAIYRA